MSKITAYSENTAPLLTDLAVMVDDPGGSPLTQKILLANLLALRFGMIYTTGGTGTQTPGTSYVKLTQFDSNGLASGNVTPDAANNKITLVDVGIYVILLQVSFQGSNSEPVMMRVYWNSVAQPQLTFRRVLGAGGDCGSASIMGVIDETAGSTDVEIYVKTDTAAKTVDVKEAQLTVIRIAGT